MSHQLKGLPGIIALITTLALICSNAAQAVTSDDFNPATPEPNPAWRFYDPLNTSAGSDPGESTLTFSGTNALISVPAGTGHDLWRGANNRAPRLLQTTANTDFGIEAKFEAIPNTATQIQGIIVQQSDNVFLRFDLYYDGAATPRLFVAYVNGNTSTTFRSVLLPATQNDQYRNFPKYRRVIRSGNQWTYRYSYDRVTWVDVTTFTQALTVTEVGFFAGNGGSNPALLSSVDYFMDLASPLVDNDVWQAPAPVITAWYNYSQPQGQFGQPGTSQQWVNILGNVFSNLDLSTMTYQVNGGAQQTLSFGPDTHQSTHEDGRLAKTGDFNVEIDPINLNVGSNTIEIRATDSNGVISSKLVSLDYAPVAPGAWPLPYTANWLSTDIDHIENIAHIVDGKWKLTTAGIRTDQPGYDRAIAIGDMDWASNYEVTVPFTLYTSVSGIGFAVGWQGHEGTQSPRIEWPLQALAWFRGPASSKPSLEIMTYGGLQGWEVIQAKQTIPRLSLNTGYFLKAHSESLGNGTSQVFVKYWLQSAAEPAAWNLNAFVPTRPGSVLLVAYNGDAAFGNVSIVPVSGSSDTTPPVLSNVQAVATSTGATVTWTTDEAANSVVNYGLTTSYGTNGSNTAQVTSHSIALTGLSPSTTYHYRVNSTDASNNTATGSDFSFTTPAASGGSSGLVSDSFNTGTLDARWTFYDPLGNSTQSMTGTQASISVPAGSAHDLWTNALNAPRIRQAANNTDFDVVVKFDSAVSSRYQIQGLTVEQDNTNFLRFDFFSTGSVTRVFSASIVNGTASNRISTAITAGVPLYLRVQRVGSQWTESYSYNGTTWTVAGSYTFALTVSSVGIFAGNAGSPVPAHTALIDSFSVQ